MPRAPTHTNQHNSIVHALGQTFSQVLDDALSTPASQRTSAQHALVAHQWPQQLAKGSRLSTTLASARKSQQQYKNTLTQAEQALAHAQGGHEHDPEYKEAAKQLKEQQNVHKAFVDDERATQEELQTLQNSTHYAQYVRQSGSGQRGQKSAWTKMWHHVSGQTQWEKAYQEKTATHAQQKKRVSEWAKIIQDTQQVCTRIQQEYATQHRNLDALKTKVATARAEYQNALAETMRAEQSFDQWTVDQRAKISRWMDAFGQSITQPLSKNIRSTSSHAPLPSSATLFDGHNNIALWTMLATTDEITRVAPVEAAPSICHTSANHSTGYETHTSHHHDTSSHSHDYGSSSDSSGPSCGD